MGRGDYRELYAFWVEWPFVGLRVDLCFPVNSMPCLWALIGCLRGLSACREFMGFQRVCLIKLFMGTYAESLGVLDVGSRGVLGL